jgi:PIN domain nuclease of toxin-antitoxin system
MILLDTCALLWWTSDPEKLSSSARKVCQKIDGSGASVSSISLWELGIKIKKRKLNIGMTIESYLEKLRFLNLMIEPVTDTVWLRNLALKWANRDPADRTIVATATLLSLPIVSADSEMRRFYKRVIW